MDRNIPSMTRAKQRYRSLVRADALWGYLFIAPSILGFSLFVLGPLVAVFIFSLQSRNLLTGHVSFIGLENYREMLFGDPLFVKTMLNSLVFTAGLVPLNIVLALAFAILLGRQTGISRLFQTIFFAPVVTSAVAWAIVWRFMLQGQQGVVNQALGVFGINGPNWLFEPASAMFAVIFTRAIKGVGLNMVIFLSALSNIPEDFHDAARVDGASEWHIFRHITFPLLAPTTLMVTIITIIGSLKVFDTIVLLTNGGPSNSTTVLVYYIYYQAFRFFETGYASALAVVLFLVALGFTVIQWGLRRRLVYAEQ
jgi:multiple sugar transport system permease protein